MKPIDEELASRLYDQIPLAEEEDEDGSIMEKHIAHSRRPNLRRVWSECLQAPKTLVTAGFLATVAFGIVILSSAIIHTPGSWIEFQSTSQKNSLQPHFTDDEGGPIELAGTHRCGSFPSQALVKGCVFDVMNYGFTASECFYEDLYQEALGTGPWKWYLGKNGTIPIPQEDEILKRSVEVWTELEYHVEHCKYTQRLIRRAEEDDSFLVPQELARSSHTKHCENLIERYMLGEWESGQVLNTWIRMIYNPCVRLSEVENESVV